MNRSVSVVVEGRVHEIPEAWIVGFCRTWADDRTALSRAIRCWDEQTVLGALAGFDWQRDRMSGVSA